VESKQIFLNFFKKMKNIYIKMGKWKGRCRQRRGFKV